MKYVPTCGNSALGSEYLRSCLLRKSPGKEIECKMKYLLAVIELYFNNNYVEIGTRIISGQSESCVAKTS